MNTLSPQRVPTITPDVRAGTASVDTPLHEKPAGGDRRTHGGTGSGGRHDPRPGNASTRADSPGTRRPESGLPRNLIFTGTRWTRRHLKVCAPDNDLADIMRTLAMPRV